MRKYLDLMLGVAAAIGGFLDLGQMLFALQIGAKFAYLQMWVLLLGTIAIIVFMEMSGRIAAVAQQPSFVVIREQLGPRGGWVTLVAATLVNLLTCAAEIGGVGIILKLLLGGSLEWQTALAFVALFLFLMWASFTWVENLFGLLGLLTVVFAVAAYQLHPHWGDVFAGFIPSSPQGPSSDVFFYWYSAVALFSAVLLPYEVYLYSSGAIEDDWDAEELGVNRITTIFGCVFGALLTVALIVIGASIFQPLGMTPQLPGSTIYGSAMVLGKVAGVIALVGMLFAIAGAAVETGLSGAYGIAQFLGWPWGKSRKMKDVRRFTATWMIILAVGAAIILFGVDPVKLVQYVIIISVIPLPLTYYPVLMTASDEKIMGKHKNPRWITIAGWCFFVLTCIATAAAIPLLIVTHGGQG